MMKKSIILSCLIGSAALCCMNGCVPVVVAGAAGVGYGWVKGEYKVAVDHDVIATYEAAVAALGDLKMPISAQKSDGISAEIKAERASGEAIMINIQGESSTRSIVSIRVGYVNFKSKKEAELIFKYLESHLR